MTTLAKSMLWLAAGMLTATLAHASTPLTIDTVISDITAPSNEAIPRNPVYDWQEKPHIVQYSPSGSSLPSWWEGNRPEWCYTLNSWFTTFEAGGLDSSTEVKNTATNTRVQFRNLRIYVYSNHLRKWIHANTAIAPDTTRWRYGFISDGALSTAELRPESSGGYSVKPAYPKFQHGWGKPLFINAPWDVRGVFVAMEFRLVVDNPALADDRAKARYVVNVGADYWPGNGQNWGVNYAPGVGSGRYLLATNEWRTATLLVPNKDLGATFDEIRHYAPPLELPPAQ